MATADRDVKEFVNRNFYVDDGLLSTSCEQEAVNITKRTHCSLWDGAKFRLHKIA